MNEKKLHDAREAKQLSVREVAIETGLTEQTIREIEKGRNKNPTISTVKTLCDFYEIPISEVLSE